MPTAPVIEPDIAGVAEELLGASGRSRGYGPRSRLLGAAMADSSFKTELFRFVDVFPSCRTPAEVTAHLREYLGTDRSPRALRALLAIAAFVPLGDRVAAGTAAAGIRTMAKRFVVAEDPAGAVRRARRLWRSGQACTVDILGEKTVTDGEADRYGATVAKCLAALGAAARTWPARAVLDADSHGQVPRINLSVKPTALSPLLTPLTAGRGIEAALARVEPIARGCIEAGATLHFDTEHDEAKDLTLELVRRVGEAFAELDLGCVIQAYRRDACDDLGAMIDWAAGRSHPLQIRLVKGAYWDHETTVALAEGWRSPVFSDKAGTDANFEQCAAHLIAHASLVRPIIASHNLRSVAVALATCRAAGLPDTAVELQLLSGMAPPLHQACRALGLRSRVYCPVGPLIPGMAYLVRRLLENTSNESFVRQFADRQPLADLLQPPRSKEDTVGHEATVVSLDARRNDPFVNEPPAEFRRAATRSEFTAAVDLAAGGLGFEVPILIGGRATMTGDRIVSVDPGDTTTLVCTSARATPAHASSAIDAASDALGPWGDLAWPARAGVLRRTAALMRAQRAALAALICLEAGKPLPEADAEVCEAIDFCEFYARGGLALEAGAPVVSVPGEANSYRYGPRGVAAVISPWNFPLAIPMGMIAAALVSGNPVVFKPAEQTPGVALRLVELFLEAGLPAEALALLPGHGDEVGDFLVTHPGVQTIAFTGSKQVGLSILAKASLVGEDHRHIKRVVAEMGGKNAIVVDSDADLDVAVPAILHSAFGYAGQKCSAASRVIAVGSVWSGLVDRLAGAADLLAVGCARDLDTVCGPLIDDRALEKFQHYRGLAAIEGDIVYERGRVPAGGWYAPPVIVTVPGGSDARVVTDEVFGPLLCVQPARDFEDALGLANATAYGLTAGLFSRSPSHIDAGRRRLRAGNVYVNRGITGARVGRQPFGGVGLSGTGPKAGGPDYLLAFVEPRVVTENTVRQGFTPELL